jgi:hypothetical protein
MRDPWLNEPPRMMLDRKLLKWKALPVMHRRIAAAKTFRERRRMRDKH